MATRCAVGREIRFSVPVGEAAVYLAADYILVAEAGGVLERTKPIRLAEYFVIPVLQQRPVAFLHFL